MNRQYTKADAGKDDSATATADGKFENTSVCLTVTMDSSGSRCPGLTPVTNRRRTLDLNFTGRSNNGNIIYFIMFINNFLFRMMHDISRLKLLADTLGPRKEHVFNFEEPVMVISIA